MIAFIFELVISFFVAKWVWTNIAWWAGIIAFILIMGITNSALGRGR